MPADGPRYRLVIHPIAKADLASIWYRMYRFRRYGQRVDTIAARHLVLPVFSCAALPLTSVLMYSAVLSDDDVSSRTQRAEL